MRCARFTQLHDNWCHSLLLLCEPDYNACMCVNLSLLMLLRLSIFLDERDLLTGSGMLHPLLVRPSATGESLITGGGGFEE